MIEIFAKDKDNRNRQYKNAMFMDDNGNTENFKFWLLDNITKDKMANLWGVIMEAKTMVIRTSYQRQFKINDIIVIDNMRYKVMSIYYQNREQDNGLFRKSLSQYQFLTLKH